MVRAKRPQRLPVVLPYNEVNKLLQFISGTNGLIAHLMYGISMRLMEALRLRVKDIDFSYRQILVRSGKGDKDRVTLLSDRLMPGLERQLAQTKTLHDADLAAGFGQAYLPFALARKYPNADREFA